MWYNRPDPISNLSITQVYLIIFRKQVILIINAALLSRVLIEQEINEFLFSKKNTNFHAKNHPCLVLINFFYMIKRTHNLVILLLMDFIVIYDRSITYQMLSHGVSEGNFHLLSYCLHISPNSDWFSRLDHIGRYLFYGRFHQ